MQSHALKENSKIKIQFGRVSQEPGTAINGSISLSPLAIKSTRDFVRHHVSTTATNGLFYTIKTVGTSPAVLSQAADQFVKFGDKPSAKVSTGDQLLYIWHELLENQVQALNQFYVEQLPNVQGAPSPIIFNASSSNSLSKIFDLITKSGWLQAITDSTEVTLEYQKHPQTTSFLKALAQKLQIPFFHSFIGTLGTINIDLKFASGKELNQIDGIKSPVQTHPPNKDLSFMTKLNVRKATLIIVVDLFKIEISFDFSNPQQVNQLFIKLIS